MVCGSSMYRWCAAVRWYVCGGSAVMVCVVVVAVVPWCVNGGTQRDAVVAAERRIVPNQNDVQMTHSSHKGDGRSKNIASVLKCC